MSKSIIVGSTLAVFGLGGLAFGAWQVQQAPQGPQFANITAVTPVTETVSTPRQVCENVQVSRQAPTRDPHSILGSAAGAVVGGLVGPWSRLRRHGASQFNCPSQISNRTNILSKGTTMLNSYSEFNFRY